MTGFTLIEIKVHVRWLKFIKKNICPCFAVTLHDKPAWSRQRHQLMPLETIQASPWHRYAHIYPNLVPNFLNYSLIWNCVCLKWNSEISSCDAQASFGPLSWAAPHSSTNFSVDTHCSGIHFPPDSLQNPDLSLILRPFVIQKTGINNTLYMTESKEQKKKKSKSGAPKQMVCFMVGKENPSLWLQYHIMMYIHGWNE